MSNVIAALSSKEFHRALKLFGFTDQNVYGCIMADNFPKEGQSLVKMGYLSEGAITTNVPDRWSDNPCAWVKVEWNPETRTYGYYCISAIGVEWIDVPE